MIENWFSTPIYYEFIKDPAFSKIQQDLEHAFNQLIADDKFGQRKGYSHLISSVNFDSNFIEEYKVASFNDELTKHIKLYLDQVGYKRSPEYYISESWMTLTKKGMSAHKHTHGYVDISGCYYFKTSTEDGSIYFENPVKQMASSYCFSQMPEQTYYKPQVGKLLLFPGWLEHGVEPNTTDTDRISISFNIVFKR
jgi:uncharacterized protein (TIGR02466 family)